jgi:hypothetical protein
VLILYQVIAHLSLCDNHIHSEGGKFLGRALQVPQKSPNNTLQAAKEPYSKPKSPTDIERAILKSPNNTLQAAKEPYSKPKLPIKEPK